jgi:hypothetical protein
VEEFMYSKIGAANPLPHPGAKQKISTVGIHSIFSLIRGKMVCIKPFPKLIISKSKLYVKYCIFYKYICIYL